MLNPLEIEALKLSGFIAIVAVSVSVIPGIIIAWIISRKKGLISSTLNMIVYLPLVLPPVVIGYLLLLLDFSVQARQLSYVIYSHKVD